MNSNQEFIMAKGNNSQKKETKKKKKEKPKAAPADKSIDFFNFETK